MKNKNMLIGLVVLFLVSGLNAQTFRIANFSREKVAVKPYWEGHKNTFLELAPGKKSKLYDSGLKPVKEVWWWVGGDTILYEASNIGGNPASVEKEFAILQRGRYQHNLALSFFGSNPKRADIKSTDKKSIDSRNIVRIANKTSKPINFRLGTKEKDLKKYHALLPNEVKSFNITGAVNPKGINWVMPIGNGIYHYYATPQLRGESDGVEIEILDNGAYLYGNFGESLKQDQGAYVV